MARRPHAALEPKRGFTRRDAALGFTRGSAASTNVAKATWVDWTAGCIAIGSDESIDDVAAPVRRHRITSIVIE